MQDRPLIIEDEAAAVIRSTPLNEGVVYVAYKTFSTNGMTASETYRTILREYGFVASMAGAAIHMTTPKPRAS